MIRRVVLCIAVVACVQSAPAQEPQCRLYKVQSNSLNISKEPRGAAVYIDTLDNADVVCVTRERKVGERNWGFVEHKLLTPDQRKPVAGWANMALLQRLADNEGASVRGLTASPPAAAAAPAPATPAPAPATTGRGRRALQEPLTSGPYPVNGSSLEQLVNGIPLFPPIEGLDEAVWKKQCTSCHKWDQGRCASRRVLRQESESALRGSHPFGGAEKVALMQWAKTGCQ